MTERRKGVLDTGHWPPGVSAKMFFLAAAQMRLLFQSEVNLWIFRDIMNNRV
jgi:hypothetical protein